MLGAGPLRNSCCHSAIFLVRILRVGPPYTCHNRSASEHERRSRTVSRREASEKKSLTLVSHTSICPLSRILSWVPRSLESPEMAT